MNAVPIPDGVSAEQALMMTDALATAWFGARNADIKPGSSVAIVGLGPIGLLAVDSAFVMGAHVVYAIDPIPERRKLAEEEGALYEPPHAAERRGGSLSLVRGARGRGAQDGADAGLTGAQPSEAAFAALSTARTLAVATSSSMPTPQIVLPCGVTHST